MNVRFSKNFLKQYKKLRAIQKKIDERLVLFRQDSHDPILNNHAPTGEYKGYRSINITGDFRALYEPVDSHVAFFITVDKHSNLYA